MNKVTGNVEWEMVFENKLAANSEIATLVNKAMDAWHKAIEYYSHHSYKACRTPYEHNERTSCGVFASAIAKYIDDSGSVLTEFPTNKKSIATGGRIDIEWITQDNQHWIIFESKQRRKNLEEGTIEEIHHAFFAERNGLVAQSARDFGKYQGSKRLSHKSRDQYYHVGLLFCPAVLNNSIANEDIGNIFKKLESKVPCRRLDKNNKIGELSKIDFSKRYSCVYLYNPHEQGVYGLITAAIVFRSP